MYVKEALANGRLAGREVAGALPQPAAEGVTLDALALAAVLAKPWADVVLSGAASLETLRSNLRAADVDDVSGLDDLVEEPEAYWARRSSLPWN